MHKKLFSVSGWVLGLCLTMGLSAFGQTGNDPKQAVVTVTNSDTSPAAGGDVTFQAFITARPAEILTELTATTFVAGPTGFQFDLLEFPTQWAAGETLTVNVLHTTSGETGSDSVVLTLVDSAALTVQLAAVVCDYTLSHTSTTLVSTAHTDLAVDVTTDPATGCPFSATSEVAWVQITSGMDYLGSDTVLYDVDANPSSMSRTGTMTIAGQTFTVEQDGAPCVFMLDPTEETHPFTADTGSFDVEVTPADCTWTATTAAAWINLTPPASGTGPGTVDYDVTMNDGATARTGMVMVADQTFTVTQAAPPCVPTPSGGALLPPNQDVTLSWCPVDGAVGYQLWIARKGLFGNYWLHRLPWIAGTGTTYAAGVLPCGEYRWFVRPYFGFLAFGPWEAANTFEVDCCDITQPNLLAPMGSCVDTTSNTLTYSWEGDACSTWYLLWVNKDFLPFSVKWINTGAVAGTVEQAVPGHSAGNYQWWVRPWGPEGFGPFSESGNFDYGLIQPLSLSSTEVCWDETCLGDPDWVEIWVLLNGWWPVYHKWIDLSTEDDNCVELDTPLDAGNYDVIMRTYKAGVILGLGPVSDRVTFSVVP